MNFLLLLGVSHLALSLPSCHAFAPGSTADAASRPRCHPSRGRRLPSLAAVTQRQTCILDGAELSYYVKSLARTEHALPDVAPRAPRKRHRIGAVSLATATADRDVPATRGGAPRIEAGRHVIGVPVSPSVEEEGGSRDVVSLGGGVRLYRDSIAILPPRVSPADAISTAAASLLGVHCAAGLTAPSQGRKEKIVIVGGGEHALFLAKALAGLGHRVSLVTARPAWSLPSPAELAPAKEKAHLIDILSPAVGALSLGFAAAVGDFDTLIDTLGDEQGLGNARSIDGDFMDGGTFMRQLKELHGCDNYVSTLTRSQQYVLKQGLLFARDPVLRYQREAGQLTAVCHVLPPPVGFGATVQLLLDQRILRPAPKQEGGAREAPPNLVQGWSLSDLTELKTWPMEGPRRFGFPAADVSASSLSLLRQAMAARADENNPASVGAQQPEADDRGDDEEYFDADMMVSAPTPKANAPVRVTQRSAAAAAASSPHVATIRSAGELQRRVVAPGRDCILFLTASYCQKCKQLTPQLNRVARAAAGGAAGVLFARVDVAAGPRGRQLGEILGAGRVPAVVVFRGGDARGTGGAGPVGIGRGNVGRLAEVARALESGARNVGVEELLASETTVKK